MPGTNTELDAAHEALVRARDDLARRLDAEPAWRALAQLEAREASGDGPSPAVDFKAIRANLIARLDAAIPQWRTLADIDAALAALGTNIQRPSQPEAGSPPPIPTSSVPHVQVEPERTRFSSHRRPAPVARPSNGRGAPPLIPAPPRKPEAPLPAAPTRRAKSTGGRLAAALGLVNDGPARLSAIESEVERLMRRDAGTWEKPPARTPRPARLPPAPPEPIEAPAAYDGEEAEVEIVWLTPDPRPDERRPMTRLSDRLSRVGGGGGPEPQVEPVVSMQAHIEEADVEIEVQGDADQPKALPAPVARPDED